LFKCQHSDLRGISERIKYGNTPPISTFQRGAADAEETPCVPADRVTRGSRVDKNGKVVAFFESVVTPEDRALRAAIAKALAAS